jgi:hypothetical protein
MLLSQLYTKLEKSSIFENFKSSNPDAFLCAGFFILNFKSQIFDYSLDFKSNNKIFTFKIPVAGEIVMLEEDIIASQKPLEKITIDVQIDINDLRESVEKEIYVKGIKSKLEEVIAVLQVHEGKEIWNITAMCEGFTIISIHIDPESGRILKFEKKSLFDMVKKA